MAEVDKKRKEGVKVSSSEDEDSSSDMSSSLDSESLNSFENEKDDYKSPMKQSFI